MRLAVPLISRQRPWLYGDGVAGWCPYCGDEGVPLLYGLPGHEARLAEGDGQLVLGGCVEPPDPLHWQCARQHRWRDPDESLWERRVLAVLVTYGYNDDQHGDAGATDA
jgi:hypothetical protein